MKVWVKPSLVRGDPVLALWVHRVRCAESFWHALAIARKKMGLITARNLLISLGNPPGVTDPVKKFIELVTESTGQKTEAIYVTATVRSHGRHYRLYRAPLKQYGRSIPAIIAQSAQIRKRP